MVCFKQAADGELDFIRKFAEKEFNESNFAQMLPKLYSDNVKSEFLHNFLYDDDEIKGMFALQIKDFIIAGIKLRVGWLGSVCVKSSARGNGYLANIMEYSNLLLKQNNCDISVLGGQRQRYKRFGYEYGGSHWIFNFTSRNLKDTDENNISLRPLNEKKEWVDAAYNLYKADLITGARTKDDFYKILSSWNSRPHAIVMGDTFTGYCSLQVCRSYGQVYEMRLVNSELTLNVCKAILNKSAKDEIVIFQCLWADSQAFNLLSSECESARLAENHSYKILNWQKVILAGLMLKDKCSMPIQSGELLIKIENSGTYKIIVSSEKTSVQCCESTENIDLFLTQKQAVLSLLGHTSNQQNNVFAGWLPLPIGFSWLDGI